MQHNILVLFLLVLVEGGARPDDFFDEGLREHGHPFLGGGGGGGGKGRLFGPFLFEYNTMG